MYKFWLLLVAVLFTLSTNAKSRKVNKVVSTQEETLRKRLIIPNIISSVDTAYPSTFQILNLDKEEIILFTIYNKWGTSMYSSKDSTTAAWDGTHKGKMQPDGEYGYKIRVKYEDGVTEEYQGILMLVNNFKTKSM